MSNQKNGRMGQTIHNHALHNNPHCPIKAIANRVHHILSHKGSTTTLLCVVFMHQAGPPHWSHVTAPDMLQIVRQAVTSLSLHEQGIDPDLVGVHSLQAGGAMALKLNAATIQPS